MKLSLPQREAHKNGMKNIEKKKKNCGNFANKLEYEEAINRHSRNLKRTSCDGDFIGKQIIAVWLA